MIKIPKKKSIIQVEKYQDRATFKNHCVLIFVWLWRLYYQKYKILYVNVGEDL